MKVLYVASDQQVPGRTGGSVHVFEVARGLAARGHTLDVVVRRTAGSAAEECLAGARWHRLEWFPGSSRFTRWSARAQVAALIQRLRPDALMERYYNFGGEGVLAAAAAGVPALLEVNSPVVDHPGSRKALLDALLLVRPLRRHRERLCRLARALVAPLPAIVPEFARTKTETVTWGANVEAFRPDLRSAEVRRGLGIPEGACAVLFSGSFRPWHGVHVFEAAARLLSGRQELYFVLAGGPETGAAHGYRGRLLGRLPYERMPAVVAACDIGVAPYDTQRMSELRLGFFWSPLKIFEYMASGLPTLTCPRPPLDEIVRHGQEGLHVREADPGHLAETLLELSADAPHRTRLGQAARARVVERYSWQRHCAQLEGVLERLQAA